MLIMDILYLSQGYICKYYELREGGLGIEERQRERIWKAGREEITVFTSANKKKVKGGVRMISHKAYNGIIIGIIPAEI